MLREIVNCVVIFVNNLADDCHSYVLAEFDREEKNVF